MPPEESPTKTVATPTLEEIEEAIERIDPMKDSLWKAYDDLQALSPLLSSFSVSWTDLDTHFSIFQNSLIQRFRRLQSLKPTAHQVGLLSGSPLTSSNYVHPSSSTASPSPCRVDSVPDSSKDQPSTSICGLFTSSKHAGPSSSKHAEPSFSNAYWSHCRVDSVTYSSKAQPSTSMFQIGVDSNTGAVGAWSSTQVGGPSSSTSLSQHRDDVVIRPELRELSDRMDGKGLRRYIMKQDKEWEAIRFELLCAIRSAMDPGAMILDAMDGYHVEDPQSDGDKMQYLCSLRNACLLLLELLMGFTAFSAEVRERAMKLALVWKQKINLEGKNSWETLGFLHLVAAYGLGAAFDAAQFVDYFVSIARYKGSARLCRAIGLGDKAHDIIEKLIEKEKYILAAKFIFELGLTDKFPPVPLLKSYLKMTQKISEKLYMDGKLSINQQKEAIDSEIYGLKTVVKFIDIHKLEPHFQQHDSPEYIKKRIELLETWKANLIRPTAAAVKPEPQLQLANPNTTEQQQVGERQPDANQQENPNKRQMAERQPDANQDEKAKKHARTTAPMAPVAGTASAVPQSPLFPHPYQQPWYGVGGPYGMMGTPPVIPPYAGPPAGPYGWVGAPMIYHGYPNPAIPPVYFRPPGSPPAYDGYNARP